MNSETNNQVRYTQEEKYLAEKYKVEPKLVRMIAEIVCEHTAGICEVISLYSGKKKQGSEPEQEQPTESDSESPGEVAEGMVKQWLLNRDYTTKLAFVILSHYYVGDHNTEELAREIDREFEAAVVAKANNPDGLSGDELVMTGVAVEALVWTKNM